MHPEIEISRLEKTDLTLFKETVILFETVFELDQPQMPPNDHLQMLLEKDDFLVFVAKQDGRIVGGLSVYCIHQYHSTKPLAYIYDIAVDVKTQRKGVGKKLIDTVNEYCRKEGFEEVYVQADKTEDHAVNFYHTTKPTAAEEVIHFYYTL